MRAALYLTATRGLGAPGAGICYERAEALCRSLNRPLLLYSALSGQWRYSLMTDKLKSTMQIAKRIYSLAQEQDDSTLMIGAYRALAGTLYWSGDFESARQHALCGVQIWRLGGAQPRVQDVSSPAVVCLYYVALSEWHLGEIASSDATMSEAILLAKALNDMPSLALALWHAAYLAHYQRKLADVERLASDLIELSTRQNFAFWLAGGEVLRGWARSASGNTREGISSIEDGMAGFQSAAGITLPFLLALKSEALYFADRVSEALDAVNEAQAFGERSGARYWFAELHRLRGVFLATIGAGEVEIEASFREAIRIAREQKSISLEKRAEATYGEYQRQRGLGRSQFRLPPF
jgi:predicted ATPase